MADEEVTLTAEQWREGEELRRKREEAKPKQPSRSELERLAEYETTADYYAWLQRNGDALLHLAFRGIIFDVTDEGIWNQIQTMKEFCHAPTPCAPCEERLREAKDGIDAALRERGLAPLFPTPAPPEEADRG